MKRRTREWEGFGIRRRAGVGAASRCSEWVARHDLRDSCEPRTGVVKVIFVISAMHLAHLGSNSLNPLLQLCLWEDFEPLVWCDLFSQLKAFLSIVRSRELT